MSEANPSDGELHLEYSDPFHSATERIGAEDSMRRLFLIHFSCPLCGQEHSCEIYLTLAVCPRNALSERVGYDDMSLE